VRALGFASRCEALGFAARVRGGASRRVPDASLVPQVIAPLKHRQRTK